MMTLEEMYTSSVEARLRERSGDDTGSAHLSEELLSIHEKIVSTQESQRYLSFPDAHVYIGEYGKNGEIASRYLCHNNGQVLGGIDPQDLAIVTGFGMTGSPSPGTLSMIFRAIEMQRDMGAWVSIIVSDFGTISSRQVKVTEVLRRAERFFTFIQEIGFDATTGELRSHRSSEYLSMVEVISSLLSVSDFRDYTEATDDLYTSLGLLTPDFAMMHYRVLMAADILLPLVTAGKRHTLVTTGLEEHYHPTFARRVIRKIIASERGFRDLLPEGADVSAFYTRTIHGAYPYPKMSRSIPGSGIFLDDDEDTIRRFFESTDPVTNVVILEIMDLATDWPLAKCMDAQAALMERDPRWNEYKEELIDLFLRLRRLWLRCEPKRMFAVREVLGW